MSSAYEALLKKKKIFKKLLGRAFYEIVINLQHTDERTLNAEVEHSSTNTEGTQVCSIHEEHLSSQTC